MKKRKKKKLKLATALQYKEDKHSVPRVVARGEGAAADEIEAVARAHDVPIQENEVLSAALSGVPVGEEIPGQLYVAVAEVLSFVYYLKGKTPQGYEPK